MDRSVIIYEMGSPDAQMYTYFYSLIFKFKTTITPFVVPSLCKLIVGLRESFSIKDDLEMV